MKSYDWTASFHSLYAKALKHYQNGNRDVKSYFTPEECDWLASMGCKPMEMYDFAEDYPNTNINPETALLITAVRRDYFLYVMNGRHSGKLIAEADLPLRDEELEGIRWLPRIIRKAKAKLRGEMPDALMFNCGGDRGFLKRFDIHPADFLRTVWAADGDDQRVVDFVKSRDAIHLANA